MASSRYPEFNWQQTKPHYWERDIDEAERFYACLAKSYEGSGRMFFAITGFVSVSIRIADNSFDHDVEAALRRAWLKLRYDCPTIASCVRYDTARERHVKYYKAFDPNHLEFQTESWLSETFVPITPNMSGLDWCNSDPLAPKTPTLFVITPPYINGHKVPFVRRDLVLRAPHDIIDGIGTLQLLNQLLKYAAQYYEQPSSFELPSPGCEIQNLSPPLRVAASIPPILTLEEQKRLQNIISQNAKLRQNVDVLSLPYNQGLAVPGKHQRSALALSRSDTTRILQACKGLGATVTHIFHASVALLLRDLQPSRLQARTARYINYCLVNERSHCKAPYNGPDYAASVYHSVSGNSLTLDLKIPSVDEMADEHHPQPHEARKEFHALVDQVREFYTSIRNSPEDLSLAPAFWSMATPHVTYLDSTNALDTPIPAPNTSPSVSISSMGILDNVVAPQHGAFEAKDPWVTGEELGTGIGVFLGTWQGRLQLSAAYNEAWHDVEEVRGFLEGLSGIAWRGLGLGDGTNGEPHVDWLH